MNQPKIQMKTGIIFILESIVLGILIFLLRIYINYVNNFFEELFYPIMICIGLLHVNKNYWKNLNKFLDSVKGEYKDEDWT